jgi:hypothetical protein
VTELYHSQVHQIETLAKFDYAVELHGRRQYFETSVGILRCYADDGFACHAPKPAVVHTCSASGGDTKKF